MKEVKITPQGENERVQLLGLINQVDQLHLLNAQLRDLSVSITIKLFGERPEKPTAADNAIENRAGIIGNLQNSIDESTKAANIAIDALQEIWNS